MIRFYFTLLFFVSSLSYSFCQSNWKEGYVIHKDNDTLSGFIDDRGSKINTLVCFYKATLDSEEKKYSPKDIRGYRFKSGKFFISKKINDQNFKDPLFLEFLIKGEVNIYHMNVGVNRYFIEKDTLFRELKNTTNLVTVEHKKEGRKDGKIYETDYEKIGNEYKGMLKYLLNDADMAQQIQQTTFSNKSLIKVSKKYHEAVCHDEECVVFEKPKELPKINFRVHGGMSINHFNFGDKIKTDYRPEALFGLRLIYNRPTGWMEKIDFHVDLTLQNFSEYRLNVEGANETVTYQEQIYRIGPDEYYNSIPFLEVNFNATTLKIPFTVNYKFRNKKFKPYVGAGLINSLVLSQSKSFVYHKFEKEYGYSIPRHQIGFIGKIGGIYEVKNVDIYFDLNYEYSSSLGTNEYLFKNQLASFNLGIAL